MAGTRGIAAFRGEQLRKGIMRDHHFDSEHKISEDKIDIKWREHREILEDTKIDVRVQVNDKTVAGLDAIDITDDIGARPISTGLDDEGVVLTEKVLIREAGTDSPLPDPDADPVYGRIEESDGTFMLKFYSVESGAEQPYTFANDSPNIDFQYVIRTNLSVIPVDAIIKGGAGFVEGATDAKAHMNLIQLMKDLYGASGVLTNTGNAQLSKSIADQIKDEVQDRIDGDQEIRDDLVSKAIGKGASLVGVIADPNYQGVTVQDVLSDLASRIKGQEDLNDGIATRDSNSANGYFQSGDYGTAEGRVEDIETVVDAELANHAGRLMNLENEDEEEVYEAAGGETEYNLVNGVAKQKTVLLFINGAAQAPGINFTYKTNAQGHITGFNFAPDTLKVTDGIPDVLLVKYKKVM